MRNTMDKKTKICIWSSNIMWVITIALLFVSYVYMDFIATQRHGIEFWNVLINGNLKNFYSYCAENTICPAAYDFTFYGIFAIWNFPCWVYERISGLNSQECIWFVLYGKGLVLASYIVCIKIVNDIGTLLFPEKKDVRIGVTFGSSSLILVYSIYTGNYDILTVVFILAGIYYLIKYNMDSRTKYYILYLLLFSIATSMKYFAIWLFIPITLLKNKNVLVVFRDIACCVLITCLEKIYFMNDSILNNTNLNILSSQNAISSI